MYGGVRIHVKYIKYTPFCNFIDCLCSNKQYRARSLFNFVFAVILSPLQDTLLDANYERPQSASAVYIHLSYSRRFHDGRVPANYRLRRCHLARSLQPSRPSVDDQLVLPGNRGPCYDVMRGVRLHPDVHVRGALLDNRIPFQITEGLFYNSISGISLVSRRYNYCFVS